jgi:transcription elongation GreA/GreB family factor
MDKSALHRKLVANLTASRDKLASAQKLSQEGLTHEDAKAEGDKDMRATEASYVARGQAMRVEQLETDLARVQAMKLRTMSPGDPIALGAIVWLSTDDEARVVFLAPAGGGVRITQGGVTVHVVTPSSPLGRALVGAHQGDIVSFEKGGAAEECEITRLE